MVIVNKDVWTDTLACMRICALYSGRHVKPASKLPPSTCTCRQSSAFSDKLCRLYVLRASFLCTYVLSLLSCEATAGTALQPEPTSESTSLVPRLSLLRAQRIRMTFGPSPPLLRGVKSHTNNIAWERGYETTTAMPYAGSNFMRKIMTFIIIINHRHSAQFIVCI